MDAGIFSSSPGSGRLAVRTSSRALQCDDDLLQVLGDRRELELPAQRVVDAG
jgi:hypothetical protein